MSNLDTSTEQPSFPTANKLKWWKPVVLILGVALILLMFIFSNELEFYWYHYRANRGDAEAQFNLALCYDEGKRCAEALCYAYTHTYGLQVQIIRIFNTYGPRMQATDGRVICNFLEQIVRGEALSIYGSGEQTRSFQYIDDLISAIMLILSREVCTSPMNIGNPEECSIIELAQLLSELTGTKLGFKYRPMPLDDPRRRCPDISLAQKTLGWKPMVSLRDGLLKVILSWKNKLF